MSRQSQKLSGPSLNLVLARIALNVLECGQPPELIAAGQLQLAMAELGQHAVQGYDMALHASGNLSRLNSIKQETRSSLEASVQSWSGW